jgi:translation initiation factor 5B
LTGMNGPIIAKVKALLTPAPLKEMRVKSEYVYHSKIRGAMGIKISATGLELAVAGSAVYKCDNEDQIESALDCINNDLKYTLDNLVEAKDEGVVVQTSSIGSLEALLKYLKDEKIPVAGVNIGPVHRKDVMKALKSANQG